MGGAVLPACCLGGTAVVMKVTAAPSEGFCSHGCTQCPCLQQATIPAARQRPLDTHGRAGLRLLWGRCSFLRGPGVHRVFFCAFQESISPVLCKLWRLHSGVNGDRLQGGLCQTQVYCSGLPQGWGSGCSRPGCGSSLKCKKTT